ncbi:putative RING-box protein 2-like isoform 4 [Scophthalmus maximus]|uniref:RING-box protein 2 n=1 Tax=Scophthalmus maximus TaxID=52904 RepID=A0A2U9B5D9_SCOMX|nr:putative RING-box protein 2-like isoform 4 [Scophthalmus maximus]
MVEPPSISMLFLIKRSCRAAEMDDGEEPGLVLSHNTHNTHNTSSGSKSGGDKMFSLKKWNAVAMWSWDVECDTCAICRVQVMDACLRCQAENKQEDCVVVWGECNHSFHNCCMSLWVKQNNRCPLCQQDWVVQRIGK